MAWNALGGVLAGVLVVVTTPFYVSRLGLEGYGIVGLWLVMQVMLGLLDVGMGATVIKSFAGASADLKGHEYKRDLLRTLEVFYWSLAVAVTVILAVSSDWIGTHWLKPSELSSQSVGNALRLIAIALGFQFPGALYSSGLAGLQEQGRMNAIQIIGNLLRYGGGVLVLLWRADIEWFFRVQVVAAAIQTLATRQVLWPMISALAAGPAGVRLELIRETWRYSAGMAFTTLAAVLMGNADRLALSKLLPTAELGKYSIAFTASGVLQLCIQPFYRAFFPRYAELVSGGSGEQLRAVYYRSCRLLAFAIVPMGIVGFAFAPELLSSWVQRSDETVTLTFRWLLVGITCAGLMWLPAAFQQANGWTGLHASLIGGALVVGAPFMVWAITTRGTVGATTIWVMHGISALTLGLWLMHRRLLVGELLTWYRDVLLPPLLVALPITAMSWWAMPEGMGRWMNLAWPAVTGLAVIGSALALGLIEIPAHAPAPSQTTKGPQ